MNWLLLRGLYRHQLHWGEFPETFSGSLPGIKPVLLDLPGCGSASHVAVPWSVPAMTQELRARWLEHRKRTPGQWSLLAVSLGAMVALDWCDRYPADFERLVVINTSARNLSSRNERFNPRFLPSAARIALSGDVREQESAILEMTSNLKAEARATALERNVEIAKRKPIPRSVAVRQLAAAARFSAPHRLAVPALVISSLGDKLVSPAVSARLARRIGATHAEHPWSGHDLPLDDPGWLARTVADWCVETRIDALRSNN